MTPKSLIALRFVRALCLIGIVAPYFLAQAWAWRELNHIRATGVAIELLRGQLESYPCLRTDCQSYPEARNAEELARELGPELAKRLPTVDGWGHPLQVVTWPEGYVIVSTGADGKVDDDIRPLLELQPGHGWRIAQLAAALAARSERRRYAGNAAGTSWLDERNADIVVASNNHSINARQTHGEGPEPDRAVNRIAIALLLPALVLYLALTLALQLLSGQQSSARAILIVAGRAGQILCVVGLFAPFHFTRVWVTNSKRPIRVTLDNIVSVADALDYFSRVRHNCEPITDRQKRVVCTEESTPYPLAGSIDELAHELGAAYSGRLSTRDGWGHPLLVRSWASHYIIASGGADGKLDATAAELLTVPAGDDARLAALAAAIRTANKGKAISVFETSEPWRYTHLEDDDIYVDGQYVEGIFFNSANDSYLEAPRAVFLHYVRMMALPSLLLLILLTIVIQRSTPPGRTVSVVHDVKHA